MTGSSTTGPSTTGPSPTERPDAVATTGIAKDYGAGPALEPLDLVVPAGQRVALLGHNGSGKTTLIRMLAGVLDPTSGTASVAGHPAGSLPARAALAYLADHPVFYDDLSLGEHLEYVARLHGVDGWEPTAEALLDHLGLTARVDDLPTTFSRGLRQKAAICLAFVRPFAVLVVDEPFVGLDADGRAALLDLLHESHAGGAALLVATHELQTVAASERVVVLRDGQVAFDGSPGDADLAALVRG